MHKYYRNEQGRFEISNNRTFRSPDDEITGKSIVSESSHISPIGSWPYPLTDYLNGYIGKTVQAGYLISNGRYIERSGKLIVTGSNFIGIQPINKADLFIIELTTLKCINIINYNA